MHIYQPGYRFPILSGGGKSGQQRATHRLTAGVADIGVFTNIYSDTESATENYHLSFVMVSLPKHDKLTMTRGGQGENVR